MQPNDTIWFAMPLHGANGLHSAIESLRVSRPRVLASTASLVRGRSGHHQRPQRHLGATRPMQNMGRAWTADASGRVSVAWLARDRVRHRLGAIKGTNRDGTCAGAAGVATETATPLLDRSCGHVYRLRVQPQPLPRPSGRRRAGRARTASGEMVVERIVQGTGARIVVGVLKQGPAAARDIAGADRPHRVDREGRAASVASAGHHRHL